MLRATGGKGDLKALVGKREERAIGFVGAKSGRNVIGKRIGGGDAY